jgi:hypothetical protein
MSPANLALRFLLELALLAALGVWGAHAGATGFLSDTLAVAAPLAAVILWGAFVSPKARVPAGWQARLGVELALFGAAIAGLAVAGFPKLAAASAAAVAFHQTWRVAETRRPAR